MASTRKTAKNDADRKSTDEEIGFRRCHRHSKAQRKGLTARPTRNSFAAGRKDTHFSPKNHRLQEWTQDLQLSKVELKASLRCEHGRKTDVKSTPGDDLRQF